MTRAGEQGFSLIEALVAMTVLAIAAVGIVRATEAHVDTIRGLEDRAAAGWAADNRLAELHLPGDAGRDGEVTILGRRWQVQSTSGGTSDADLRTVHIDVRRPGESNPLAALDGFYDAGTTTTANPIARP